MSPPSVPFTCSMDLSDPELEKRDAWERKAWVVGWEWKNYHDGVITHTQNKRGRVERVFDLKAIPALYELIESIPENQRFGARGTMPRNLEKLLARSVCPIQFGVWTCALVARQRQMLFPK